MGSGRQEEAEGAAGSRQRRHRFPGSKTTPGASLAAREWGDYPETQLLPSTGIFLLFRKRENTKFRYKDSGKRVSGCELNVLS